MARARTRTRDELFPADRGLMARMVLVSVLTPLTIAGLLLLYVLTRSSVEATVWMALAVACGIFQIARDARRRAAKRSLFAHEEPELQAIVGRLCAVADLDLPDIVVIEDREPNSWVVDPLWRRPRLYVTRGLLDLLEPVELEAVVAHEMAHVANRDATVMTVVALPTEALSRGSGGYGGWPMLLASLTGIAIGWVAGFGSTALSRYRELTADATAASMTGRPMALASALMKVSGALTVVPDEDLRAAYGCESLCFVGTGEPSGIWRFHGSTHPSVERRVAALERMEHALAHRRRVA